MRKKRRVNSGRMPGSGRLYEEFENLLASFVMTLEPLKGSERRDRKDRRAAVEIIEGFAERHAVHPPDVAAKSPRPTPSPAGRPRAFLTGRDLIAKLPAFWYDFRIALQPESVDGRELERLRRCLLRILARRDALTPMKDGDAIVGYSDWLPPADLPFERLYARD